ncbi:MAG: ribbon-helix-helix protein, CopG family [Acidimicrobiia bacterium]|nr:ribbon-helix-helix protein, CopG family [Acidimicrobiia bacterium]
MRLHISVDDDLVARLDERVGARGRSAFIAAALAHALEQEHRWELIEAAVGSIPDSGHEWDVDAAGWVRSGRRADARRVG